MYNSLTSVLKILKSVFSLNVQNPLKRKGYEFLNSKFSIPKSELNFQCSIPKLKLKPV